MMQELRLVLIVVGVVAITALLLHGLWIIRKEKPKKFTEKLLGKRTGKNYPRFYQDVTRSTHVIKVSTDKQKIGRKELELNPDDRSSVDPLFLDVNWVSTEENDVELSVDFNRYRKPYNVTEEEKIVLPAFSATDVEDEFEQVGVSVVPKKATTDFYQATLSHNDVPEKNKLKKTISESQNEPTVTKEVEVNTKNPEQQEKIQELVLIMNVQAVKNQKFDGTELINSLEQHGLLYGEREIFHRHAEPVDTGKILFSVANMFNPGSFPQKTINQFSTQGITLFMTLPCYGDAGQNFKLMLKTAQQVADQLGGLVTDDRRSMMTPQRLDCYRKKIKEFNLHEQ
ncbi:cell division protein ZipA [Candidatus Enterovibrio escicola]|uniref:cell division protein ZipA n=2 Tax=Candidatus Enterovibrio escicola TaxID=1927127 RepID=UPI0012383AB8|nr:cell division protein ZipA [Candidatus Enterovibrio escacola]